MGLVICRNLVDKSGGTISVHSPGADQGTTISFTMKMQKADESLHRDDMFGDMHLKPDDKAAYD
jgi:hypothetical protein